METKLCKHCKSEIAKDAKICPHCRKKQGGKLKWIILIVVIIIILGSLIGGSGDKTSSSSAVNQNVSQNDTVSADTQADTAADSAADAAADSAADTEQSQESVEYITCTVDELMDDLNNNAAAASIKYKDQYLEVTGVLKNIDSNLKYISLYPDDDFAFIGIQCFIKTDEQKEAVLNMQTGSYVTVKGKCTSVGEVLGYSLNIDSIE